MGLSWCQQNSTAMTTTTATTVNNTTSSGKRYTCPNCPYGTDRRDLYTRHENIHREEKPFHCYVCFKPFNRADHVKKHFLRMHREHGYELSRIRRTASTSGSGAAVANPNPTSAPTPNQKTTLQTDTNNLTNQNNNPSAVTHNNYATTFNNNKAYQIQTGQNANGTPGAIYQVANLPVPGIPQNDLNCSTGNRRIQNGGCNSKSHVKGGTKGAQERR